MLTNEQRLKAVERISALQDAGLISQWQASYEFDLMLMSDIGELVYYSDSTHITADWNEDVMIFHAPGSTREKPIPSNTGIYVRGPKRGKLTLRPGCIEPDCIPEELEHFSKGAKGWERIGTIQ